jgi:hypothetical protein
MFIIEIAVVVIMVLMFLAFWPYILAGAIVLLGIVVFAGFIGIAATMGPPNNANYYSDPQIPAWELGKEMCEGAKFNHRSVTNINFRMSPSYRDDFWRGAEEAGCHKVQ